MYSLDIRPDLMKKLEKLSKKNRKQVEIILKKADEILMVGDWPERDIKGAKKVGMITCFAKYGYDEAIRGKIKKLDADHVIKDIKDLLKIVKDKKIESS